MRPEYEFTPPTKDHGYLAQLQEWANHYHIQLTWSDTSVQVNGTTTVTSYPIIRGSAYHNFQGTGARQNIARDQAAAMMIVDYPNILDEASGRVSR